MKNKLFIAFVSIIFTIGILLPNFGYAFFEEALANIGSTLDQSIDAVVDVAQRQHQMLRSPAAAGREYIHRMLGATKQSALAMAANETWYFTVVSAITTSTVADIKVAFTVPSGATLQWTCTLEINAGGTVNICPIVTGSGSTASFTGNTGDKGFVFHGAVLNSTTAGNLQFQWAQNTAEASDTKVLTNSYLEAHK